MRHAPLLLALLAVAASAQVNTERMRKYLDGNAAALSFDASAAAATGNTEFLRIGLGGRADVRYGGNIGFLIGRFDLAKTDDEEFVNQSFAHLRYNRYLAPWLVAEAFTQVQQNRQERLETRVLVGAGPRFEVIQTDTLGLAIGVTPMLEHEVLDEALGGEQVIVGRVSSYLAGRVTLAEGATFSTVTYVQPRVDDAEDVRVLSQLAIEVGITRAIRLRIRGDLRIDTRPPDGVQETDLRVENGLVLVLPVQ